MSRNRDEDKLVAEFRAWIRQQGAVFGDAKPDSVGRKLKDRAIAEAERRQHSLGESGFGVDTFDPAWYRELLGKPDLAYLQGGDEWLAEAKIHFTLGSLSEGLGQLLVYGSLAQDDRGQVTRPKLALVLGEGSASGLEGILIPARALTLEGLAAEFKQQHGVTVYVRCGPGQFRLFPDSEETQPLGRNWES